MTIVNGLREALAHIAVCAGLAAASALVWSITLGGHFLHRFGLSLVVCGGLVSLTGGQLATRFTMADPNAWVGIDSHSQAEEIPYGALTSVGVFLFVSIPVIAIGLAIA